VLGVVFEIPQIRLKTIAMSAIVQSEIFFVALTILQNTVDDWKWELLYKGSSLVYQEPSSWDLVDLFTPGHFSESPSCDYLYSTTVYSRLYSQMCLNKVLLKMLLL
jgi:hypothetical protein